MLKLVIIATLALSCALGSCNRKPATPRDPRLGGYVLSGYDNSGQFIFTGTISLRSLEQNFVKGECTISRNENAPEGLLDDRGPCEGLIEGTRIEMDFAPMLDDAGYLLEGEFDGGRIKGIWKLDGFATSPPLGKFEAVKTFHSF
jgi:hypothetical protein